MALIMGLSSLLAPKKADASALSAGEIAMELITGKVLHENNPDKRLPMASTTKIMTALIIAEDCDLHEVIRVPDKAVGVEGSSIYLKKDEEISVGDLLYGLMMRSGNDSATALAIHHSGSIEKFVTVMNNRAHLLGVENTNFANPSGLPDDNHYTTARDLCNITRYAMQNETFKEVVSTKEYVGQFRSFKNKNKMLYGYDGANGVKTGYTLKAGRCLVSSAEKDGMDVICVVLNSPDMYNRSGEILDECFNGFALTKITPERVFMCDRVLCKLQNTAVLVSKKSQELEFKVTPGKKRRNPKSGEFAGTLEIYCANDLLFTGKLYSI